MAFEAVNKGGNCNRNFPRVPSSASKKPQKLPYRIQKRDTIDFSLATEAVLRFGAQRRKATVLWSRHNLVGAMSFGVTVKRVSRKVIAPAGVLSGAWARQVKC